MAAHNSDLYVAWQEQNASDKYQIRVKKYTVSTGTWSWVDGGDSNGLNYDSSENAKRPELAVYGGNLYLAWDEYDATRLNNKIQVRRYDGGSTWTAVDGGRSGLNHYPGSGETVGGGYAQDVTLTAFDGALYAAWSEQENSFYQIRVRRYDGGSTWTFVDGGTSTGINKDPLQHGFRPRLIERNGALYAVWEEEYGASDIDQLRAKCYGCASPGEWTFIDGGGDTGLNYDTSTHANIPSVGVLNNFLYLAWYEGVEPPWNTGLPNIRLKSYDGSWSTIDGGGLDYGSLTWAYNPELLAYNHVLYFVWNEESASTYVYQIRAKKYNGSSFSSIDGGGTTGLNHNTGVKSQNPSLCVLNDSLNVAWLYVTWEEGNDGAPKQLRVKKLGLPSATLDSALTESGLDSQYITVSLANTTFVDTTLSSSNFTLENVPAGLTIESITNITTTGCRINLQFNGRDFDTNLTNLGLTIAATEMAEGDALTASNVLSITATNDPESILLSDNGILEHAESSGIITVTLSGGQFANSLTPASWTVTNLPTGVSKGSVTRTSGTTVQIALSGNATVDYDSDITNVTVSCPPTDYSDSSGGSALTASSGVTLQYITPPTVVTIDPPVATTMTSATIAGNVTASGKAPVTDRGIQYKKSTDAVYSQSSAGSVGTGAFSVTIAGLTAGTVYNARAYATNEDTGFGDMITFSTIPTALTLRSASGHRKGFWGAGVVILVLIGLFGVGYVIFRK
ncbi:MAG: hypothetical protein EHM18_00685 [Acidobacteria bacterium]|nr:MAG: hypothetical protein EHM18_00685 [Acidobacteriota bacterium]